MSLHRVRSRSKGSIRLAEKQADEHIREKGQTENKELERKLIHARLYHLRNELSYSMEAEQKLIMRLGEKARLSRLAGGLKRPGDLIFYS